LGQQVTGKTYLAVAYAAALLERGGKGFPAVLSRPAVGSCANACFSAVHMRERSIPFLRPPYDALLRHGLPPERVENEACRSGIDF